MLSQLLLGLIIARIAGVSLGELLAERRDVGAWVLVGAPGSGKTMLAKRIPSVMPPMSQLNDDEIANILTYVLNDFENGGGVVSADQVRSVRAGTARPPGAAH